LVSSGAAKLKAWNSWRPVSPFISQILS
jgi:hypothetical protein